MRRLLYLFMFLGCLTCKSTVMPEPPVTLPATQSFWVGTYTDDTGSEGIYRFELSREGQLRKIGLASPASNPSYLTYANNGRSVIAVNENQDGTVEAFRVNNDQLLSTSQSESGGAHPCHVQADAAGNVLAANYTGGNVGLLTISAKGILSELLDTQDHTGTTGQTPHAHASYADPKTDNKIAVDLGTDALWLSRVRGGQFIFAKPRTLALDTGAGPRHAAFHPNGKWLYVINEYANTVTRVTRGVAGYRKGPSVSTLPPDFAGESFCADVHLSSDGKYLYGSNRGHNSIAVFAIDPRTGDLRLLANEPVRGDWPRNFTLSPAGRYLLVANQRSNNIVAFRRDATTGLLDYVSEIAAPAPVCLLF